MRSRIEASKSPVRAMARNITTDTTLYTVTTGKTLFLTSLILSFVNSSITTIGQLVIRDDTVERIPFLVPTLISGSTTPGLMTSISFIEPIQFSTNVRAVLAAGTLNASVTIVGYEE